MERGPADRTVAVVGSLVLFGCLVFWVGLSHSQLGEDWPFGYGKTALPIWGPRFSAVWV